VGTTYWDEVIANRSAVPNDRPLTEVTAELTTLLGATDPKIRDGIAHSLISSWLRRGVYDNYLSGLGDGMVAGLSVGLGETESDSVFRRSYSVLLLAEVIQRENQLSVLPPAKLLEWADAVIAWYLREQDLRGWVVAKGGAQAVAHGADTIGMLAQCMYFGPTELTVLLDVLADRLLLPSPLIWQAGEPDRVARATLSVLRRKTVPISVVKPWIVRITNGAINSPIAHEAGPFHAAANPMAFLRSLYIQVGFAKELADRDEILMSLASALQRGNPSFDFPINK
jgi:hypothetical protein